jgi:hypothetical protein
VQHSKFAPAWSGWGQERRAGRNRLFLNVRSSGRAVYRDPRRARPRFVPVRGGQDARASLSGRSLDMTAVERPGLAPRERLMWPSAGEGRSFPIFAVCCFQCLDLFKNVCHTPRPSHLASEAPLSPYISGMMRNPMRRPGTFIFALSAAAARPFSRSCDWRSLCVAMPGSLHQMPKRPEQGSQLGKPD